MGTHRLIIGETGASSAGGGADTLLSEKAFYLAAQINKVRQRYNYFVKLEDRGVFSGR